MTTLPLAPDELAVRLSRGLAPRRDNLRLAVAEPVLVERPQLGLRLLVTVTSDAQQAAERWEVTIPLDPLDLDPEIVTTSFVVTLRANLEEWWDVKDQEPPIAAWGRRLDQCGDQ